MQGKKEQNANTKKRMASASSMKLPMVIFFVTSLLVQITLASGKRCVLENYMNGEGNPDYTCKTSEVVMERLAGYIETDQCVSACGVDRGFIEISSDAFFMPEFSSNLCSPSCYQNCPNIVDLCFNLPAGEGVFLPSLCEKQKSTPHRAMLELNYEQQWWRRPGPGGRRSSFPVLPPLQFIF